MTEPIFVVADAKSSVKIPNAKVLRSAASLREAYRAPGERLWIAPDRFRLNALATSIAVPKQKHRLLMLEAMGDAAREVLEALFLVVVGPQPKTRLLPRDQLLAVLASERREDLFLAATFDPEANVIVLHRGNLTALVVPVGWFEAKPGPGAPRPAEVRVTDYGQTVALGEFEAAADAILYELDPAARRRMKNRTIDGDKSLGGSIRRLRIHRRVSRDEFGAIDGKTVARIERNEIAKPRIKTLEVTAKRLGVSIAELETY